MPDKVSEIATPKFYGIRARRGTRIGRVDGFTEVGRLRDHRWKGISIWSEKDL